MTELFKLGRTKQVVNTVAIAISDRGCGCFEIFDLTATIYIRKTEGHNFRNLMKEEMW